MKIVRHHTPAAVFLLFLIAIDLTLIYLNLTFDTSKLVYTSAGELVPNSEVDYRLLLWPEGSYSEIFQYIKAGVSALILFALFQQLQAPLALVGGLFFSYMALDDSLALHEQAGTFLKNMLPDALALLKRQALTELLFLGAVGGLLLLGGVLAYRRSDQQARRICHIFLALLAALVFCGVGMDLLHAVFKRSAFVFLMEDGGEMIVMSLITAFCVALFVASRQLSTAKRGKTLPAT